MSVLAAVLLGHVDGTGHHCFRVSAVSFHGFGDACPWRMPTKGIIEFQQEIVRWARDPDAGSDPKEILKTWRWFPRWYERVLAMKTHFAWPAQIGVAGAAVLAAFSLYISSLRRNARSLILLAIPLILYTLFWFITAPDPRYFGSAMWIFAICPALTFVAGGSRTGWACSAGLPGQRDNTDFLSRVGIPLGMDLRGRTSSELSHGDGNSPCHQSSRRRDMAESYGIQTYDSPLPSSWKDRPFLALLNPLGHDILFLFVTLLPGIACEGNRSFAIWKTETQEFSQLAHLAIGQCVHRINNDRLNPAARNRASTHNQQSGRCTQATCLSRCLL